MTKSSSPESDAKPWWRAAGIPLLSAIVGALIATYAQTGHLYLIPAGSYQDLAAILLGTVGVIVAIFGGVLAIAAFWGFAQMKQEAIRTACDHSVPAATAAALDHVKEQIGNGDIRDYILSEVERLIEKELDSPRMAKRIEARVDKAVLGNDEEDRLLDEEDGRLLDEETKEAEL